MTHPAIAAVAEILTRYNPSFAQANYAPVKKWIADGADLHLDIIPTIRTWIAKRPDIYSLGFFTPHIHKAREERVQTMTRPSTAHQRAMRTAFHVRVLGRRLPTDERWLAKYEAENGPVDALPQQSQVSDETVQIVVAGRIELD